jgi:peptide subunit release factor 1 (eRF1)
MGAKQMLAVHTDVPKNGLAVYRGELWDESRITIHSEPHRAIPGRNFSVDYKFYVDFLADMIATDGTSIQEELEELNRQQDADDTSGRFISDCLARRSGGRLMIM